MPPRGADTGSARQAPMLPAGVSKAMSRPIGASWCWRFERDPDGSILAPYNPRSLRSRDPMPASPSQASPKVGFVSLGCPKALVDSERILTQLRVEGYDLVPS